ncbi:MAG: TetR/AcrR family transcriptional regulator [Burkholderiales bacterium]|nr:TetR/AcrR family transcriptional regulator [Burkholderiales bacterium]
MKEKKTATATKTRDAERSRGLILSAALAEFAMHGLGGARIDRIAERSSLNKRLIYYYFSDKDQLFKAVLEASYEKIRDKERQLNLQALEPSAAVRKLVEFTWNYYLENPEFLTMLNSANLHKARHIQESPDILTLNSPLIELLGEILEKGRGGIDPVQLYVSIAGLSYFYLSNNSTLSVIFGRDLMTPKAQSERLSHMCEVILGYILRN